MRQENLVQNHLLQLRACERCYLNMKKLNFDVAQHVSIMGQRAGSNDELVKIVGNAQ